MPDDLTPEQQEAHAELEHAITRCAGLMGSKPTEYLGDWLVLASLPDLEAKSTRYLTLYPTGRMAPHVAHGLLIMGADLVDDNTADHDE